jgi:hypothetical protein
MTIRAEYQEDLSDERGDLVFKVTDDDYPDVEASLSYVPGPGGHLRAIEIAQRELRSGSSFAPRTPFLRPSGIADLPFARWHRVAQAQARMKSEEFREAVRAVQAELKKKRPKGLRAGQQHDARQRLARLAEDYRLNLLAGLPDPVGMLARKHQVAPGTARALIHKARKIGFLPPVDVPEESGTGRGKR